MTPSDPLLRYRSYVAEDDAALRVLFGQVEAAGELTGWSVADLDSWLRRLPGDPTGSVIADLEGDLAGIITPARNQLLVAPRHRRKGIGQRLVELGEALSEKRGLTPFLLAPPRGNAGAHAFLTALGFAYHSSLWQMTLAAGATPSPPVFPTDLIARPYRDTDLARYVALYNAAFAGHPTPLRVSVDLVRYIHALPGFDPTTILLLETAAHDLIGFCRVAIDAEEGQTAGDIHTVGLLPAWRGQGLGRGLLRWGIRTTRDRGARRITLSVEGANQGALALYLGEGFTLTEEWPRWSRPVR